MSTEHMASEQEDCDNPDCASCAAWRRYWERTRLEHLRRYACQECGALPAEPLGTVYTDGKRYLCKDHYDLAR